MASRFTSIEEQRKYYREWARQARKSSAYRQREREAARNRRAADPDKYKEKEKRLYHNSKERILSQRKAKPLCVKARTKANNDIRDKRIKRENCCVCKKLYGIEKLGEAHHSDYTKPLEITWLCRLHHTAWHRVFIPEYGHEEIRQTA